MALYLENAKYLGGHTHFEQFAGNDEHISNACAEYFNVQMTRNTVRRILGLSDGKERAGTYHNVHCIYSVMQIDGEMEHTRSQHIYACSAKGKNKDPRRDPDLNQCFVYKYFYKHKAIVKNENPNAFNSITQLHLDRILLGYPFAEETVAAVFQICQQYIPNLQINDYLLR